MKTKKERGNMVDRQHKDIKCLDLKLKVLRIIIICLIIILIGFLHIKRVNYVYDQQQRWVTDQWIKLQQNNYETFITEDNYEIQYIEELDDMKIIDLNFK